MEELLTAWPSFTQGRRIKQGLENKIKVTYGEKKSSLFLSPSPHTAQIYKKCRGKWMEKMGSGDVTQWGHAAMSQRRPDPEGESFRRPRYVS